MTEQNFELIIKTESKVLACNIKDFETQANQYLATLTQNFETDDDFAQAKEEVKELETLEKKTRQAINNVLNGSKEISELIETANQIAERFRQERLTRKNLITQKEAEIKSGIVDNALSEITTVRSQFEKEVSLALEMTIPKANISKRIQEATKNKRTLDGLKKAVMAEKNLIITEITTESARIKERLKLIPISYEYLFKDSVQLIAGNNELQPIIDERIAAEEKREAELKAKAEQEAKAKAEAEKVQVEAKAIADEMEQQQAVENPQEIAKTEPTEQLEDFVITIRLTQTTQAQAVATARGLKAQLGDCVSLNKSK